MKAEVANIRGRAHVPSASVLPETWEASKHNEPHVRLIRPRD